MNTQIPSLKHLVSFLSINKTLKIVSHSKIGLLIRLKLPWTIQSARWLLRLSICRLLSSVCRRLQLKLFLIQRLMISLTPWTLTMLWFFQVMNMSLWLSFHRSWIVFNKGASKLLLQLCQLLNLMNLVIRMLSKLYKKHLWTLLPNRLLIILLTIRLMRFAWRVSTPSFLSFHRQTQLLLIRVLLVQNNSKLTTS